MAGEHAALAAVQAMALRIVWRRVAAIGTDAATRLHAKVSFFTDYLSEFNFTLQYSKRASCWR